MADDLPVDVDRAQEGGFRHELVVAEHHVFGVVERREAQSWNPQLQVPYMQVTRIHLSNLLYVQ